MCDITYRTTLSYINLSSRFSRQNDDYNNQFYKIYNIRLEQMSKYLLEAIKKKWGNHYRICKLYKLAEEQEDLLVVIGTLFKDQKFKPSVLKALAESNQLMPQPILNHFTDESDVLYIEDELQRFKLEGDVLKQNKLVTGITCALLGKDNGDGKFEVLDYTFAEYRPQISRPIMDDNFYIIFISGLDLSHTEKSMLPIRLFIKWISGYIGNISNINISQISKIIIAGNSIKTRSDDKQLKFTMSVRTNQSQDIIDAIKLLDVFLCELCQVIDVDLMPGCNDPSNYILPQKYIHHCMLPKSVTYKSLNRVTNPYECNMNGIKLLGSSGEPISDILKYSDITDPIEALTNCLKWGHLAPTAPDTLACYPYYDNDPFILDDCPHVLFAGNQQKFHTETVTGLEGQSVRLICVPEFSSTSTVCVLNLKNLECLPVTFLM